MSGHRLSRAYGRQFEKLMLTVQGSFLPALRGGGDPDCVAVATRLFAYLKARAWLVAPEGRDMPRDDLSAQVRVQAY